MRNPLILLRSARSLAPIQTKLRRSRHAILFSLTLGFLIYWGGLSPKQTQAASPNTAPSQLKDEIAQIDAAANHKNIQSVLKFYSQNFTHSDGLTRQTLQQSLSSLWQRYPNLKYRTELTDWKSDGKGLIADTVTYITGVQTVDGREINFSAMLKSRQHFEGQKITRQDILSEQVQMTSGAKPPTVKLTLPEQVRPGQEYSLDAVVQEPLGNDLLLGAAIEEPVRVDGYNKPAPVNLELLTAGGIFKVGRAPSIADSRWISAVLVRGDGMTIITRRLRIVGKNK